MIVTVNDENESWLDILTDFLRLQRDKLRSQPSEINQARGELANIAADVEDNLLMREVVKELRSA